MSCMKSSMLKIIAKFVQLTTIEESVGSTFLGVNFCCVPKNLPEAAHQRCFILKKMQ